jgi:hypothetical protein
VLGFGIGAAPEIAQADAGRPRIRRSLGVFQELIQIAMQSGAATDWLRGLFMGGPDAAGRAGDLHPGLLRFLLVDEVVAQAGARCFVRLSPAKRGHVRRRGWSLRGPVPRARCARDRISGK